MMNVVEIKFWNVEKTIKAHLDEFKVIPTASDNGFDNDDIVSRSELIDLFNMSCSEPTALRLAVSVHHAAADSFSNTMELLFNHINKKGRKVSIIRPDVIEFVRRNKDELDLMTTKTTDELLTLAGYSSIFSFKTLLQSYLLKKDGVCVEVPLYMYMRVAIGIHVGDKTDEEIMSRIIETFELMTQSYFTHATPTLFNSGLNNGQLASCFLLDIHSDSIKGIYSSLSDVAEISKNAGGIGIAISKIRATGSDIVGTNGISNGILPMLKVFNETARYVDQCFTGETIVYTEAGPMAIRDVTTSNKLLSTVGLFRPVMKTLQHDYSGPILKIDVKFGLGPVSVTPTHQIMALKGQPLNGGLNKIINRLDKGYIAPEFYDAEELVPGDFVCFPIPKPETIVDLPEYSCDDLRFFGILIGDGWIGKEPSSTCGISVGTEDTELIEFISFYLEANGINFAKDLRADTNNLRFRWSGNNTSFKFTRDQLYDNETDMTKNIPTNFMNLPDEKLVALLRGIFETDGWITKTQCQIEMTSMQVMQTVRWMLMRLGVLSSGSIRDRVGNVSSYRNITTRKPTMLMRIPMNDTTLRIFPTATKSKFNHFFTHDGMMYCRIEKIEESTFEGHVYDFEVDGEHTYVTTMGLSHNGGGKRKGSIAVYLEPWHADIKKLIDIRDQTAAVELTCLDLFPALWIPDLFMRRVRDKQDWTLMCPNDCPGLDEVYGEKFDALYEKYESEGRGREIIKAADLWTHICTSVIETGLPYVLFKDACNEKSNQKNLGTIKSSNLCCVSAETTILTKTGQHPIIDLVGQEVEVWNGHEWSTVSPLKTRTDEKLFRVEFSNGTYLDCTHDHKFEIENFGTKKCEELTPGDMMIKFSLPDRAEVGSEDITIASVTELPGLHDTYCFNEPKRGMGVFNGHLTKQCEIVEYTSKDESAVCNLASIALPKYVKSEKSIFKPEITVEEALDNFDFVQFGKVINKMTRNLNDVIRATSYPIQSARNSNEKHRPIGLGVQGLADVFMMMRIPFDSEPARALNKAIFEHMYFHALHASADEACSVGTPYSSYEGSPVSQGILQHDMWLTEGSSSLDWPGLREKIKKHGIYNSLLVAPMPTASTAQILGNTESFEPMTSNMFVRKVLSGEFRVVNKCLFADIKKIGFKKDDLDKITNAIMADNGSIANIDVFDKWSRFKGVYRTTWEIKQRSIIDMAADRAPFIDQSQSLNLFCPTPNVSTVRSMLYYSWTKGLKTGSYYVRSRAAVDPIKFTIPIDYCPRNREVAEACMSCSG